MVQVSCVTVVLIPLIVLMLWMDVALFVNVQHLTPGHNKEPVQESPSGIHSAFEHITIKLLMLCPPMHYVEMPLTGWFVHATNIADYFSGNGVSLLALLFALLAARMFYSPSYKYHLVASINRHQIASQIPQPNSKGYLFDGVCDGLAVVFVLLGLGLTILREIVTPGRQKTRYHQLLNIDIDDVDEKSSLPPPFANVKIADGIIWSQILGFLRRLTGNQLHYIVPIFILILSVGLQVLFSSLVWNYIVYHYYILFDTDQIATTVSQQLAQNLVFKAPTTWIIIYTWRLLNPHTLMEYILIAILYKKTFEYFRNVRWIGFVIISFAGFVTYFHYQYALETIMSAKP